MMHDVLIFISGPISKGDLCHNIRQADEAFFALLRAGIPAINPMWSCFAGSVARCAVDDGVIAEAAVLPAGTTHADWYGADLAIVRRCDAVLRLPGESVGADGEVAEAAEARRLGLPVFDNVADVVAWSKGRNAT